MNSLQAFFYAKKAGYVFPDIAKGANSLADLLKAGTIKAELDFAVEVDQEHEEEDDDLMMMDDE